MTPPTGEPEKFIISYICTKTVTDKLEIKAQLATKHAKIHCHSKSSTNSLHIKISKSD